MKKRWIPFIALTLLVVFVGGILLGSATEADQQSDFWSGRMNIQNTIAVVNSDVGVIGLDGERKNYSAAIIEALEEEFTQASPVLAEAGFLEGTFGAVVTFPSHVSTGIVAFHEGNPNRVQLEFMINPNLPEREYIEIFLRILNLQQSINTSLAQTSIYSTFEQFHDAQDQVTGIFQNKEDGLTAMEIIELEEFTPSLNLEYIPENPFEPELFDGESHLTSVEGFASSVAGLYLGSYSQASAAFLTMREGLLVMSDELPVMAEDWLDNIGDWSQEWEEYGEALRRYKEATMELAEDLNQFILELDAYLDDVEALVGDANAYMALLVGWHGSLSGNRNVQHNFYGLLLTDVNHINNPVIPMKNNYIAALGVWHDNLSDGHNRLDSWLGSPAWVNQLGTRHSTLTSQLTTVGPRPVRAQFQPPLPAESPAYEAAVTAWRQRAVANSGNTGNLLVALSGDLERELRDVFGFEFHQWQPRDPVGSANSQQGIGNLGQWNVIPVQPSEGLYVDEFEEEVPDDLDLFEHQVPEENVPESADIILVPLSDLRGQLEAFDMDDFLTDDLHQGIEMQMTGFETYLDFVREGLGFHVEGNNMLLSMIYFEYINYLMGLRREIYDAEIYEIANLHESLEEFYGVHDGIKRQTLRELTSFSGAMPETRTEAGINRMLIEHTITPFEFTPPVLQGDVTADMFAGESLYSRFIIFLWIGIPLVLLVFLITLSSHLVLSKKEKEKGSEKS